MTRYQMVIITKEVALQYYQSEDKLFRLFLDYNRAYEWARPVLEKQIRYITDAVLPVHWNNSLSCYLQELGYNEEKTKEGYSYYSEKSNNNLYVTERYIYFHHAGNSKQEWEVFDCIKNLSPYVFAVNFEKEAYGWLKPLKVFSVL
ncbi:sporulation inhibitor of replication protein SirA [Alteribacillus sp. JSM 102045]|uniref:sporulation inhibitor of replication protein SirA n=1 Tax=Alteribacillus sp. JSM 102045 TaxID=1562101 RepID=UPI0035C0F6C6